MYYFNYNDYIKTIHTINLNNISLLSEEKTKYAINQREEIYRKFIKQTLHNKLIITNIINIWRKTNNSKENKLPIVIPIIIYIGKEKWNIQKEF